MERPATLEVYGTNPHPPHVPLWYWRLRAQNGKILADGGQGYSSKSNAFRGAMGACRALKHAKVVK